MAWAAIAFFAAEVLAYFVSFVYAAIAVVGFLTDHKCFGQPYRLRSPSIV